MNSHTHTHTHTHRHTHAHTHTQHEVGSIPTDSESSWANQIINLQGLNYIASVHTYCHIRDTATGTHTYIDTHTPSLSSLSFSLSLSLTHAPTHTSDHTHTHQGHKSSQHQTTELELWTGREGLVHDMNKKISGPNKAQSPQLFDAIGDPFICSSHVHISMCVKCSAMKTKPKSEIEMKSKRLEPDCMNYLLHFYKFVNAELVCSLVWRFLCRSLYISLIYTYCKVSKVVVQAWLGSNTWPRKLDLYLMQMGLTAVQS